MSPIRIYLSLPPSERKAYVDGLAEILGRMAEREERWLQARRDFEGIERSLVGTVIAWLLVKP